MTGWDWAVVVVLGLVVLTAGSMLASLSEDEGVSWERFTRDVAYRWARIRRYWNKEEGR